MTLSDYWELLHKSLDAAIRECSVQEGPEGMAYGKHPVRFELALTVNYEGLPGSVPVQVVCKPAGFLRPELGTRARLEELLNFEGAELVFEAWVDEVCGALGLRPEDIGGGDFELTPSIRRGLIQGLRERLRQRLEELLVEARTRPTLWSRLDSGDEASEE